VLSLGCQRSNPTIYGGDFSELTKIGFSNDALKFYFHPSSAPGMTGILPSGLKPAVIGLPVCPNLKVGVMIPLLIDLPRSSHGRSLTPSFMVGTSPS